MSFRITNRAASVSAQTKIGLRILDGRQLNFNFDAKEYTGLVGDTLASALLATEQRVVGRSFKYHRPRGVYTCDYNEPNALVNIIANSTRDPNSRATQVRLYQGLQAESQNAWPSLKFDLMAYPISLFSKMLGAGFYYKTFMFPNWHWFEPFIRKAAGLGKASLEPDPDSYLWQEIHCDLLIVGAGVAGLSAARCAAKQGLSVILIENDWQVGGVAADSEEQIEGVSPSAWIDATVEQLRACANVKVLLSTSAACLYDDNLLVAYQRLHEDLPLAQRTGGCGCLWKINATRILNATGATERPMVFAGNDKPGIMLNSAVRAYVKRYAVLPAHEHKPVVFFTNNNDSYHTALMLASIGRKSLIVDVRASFDDVEGLVSLAHSAGIEVRSGSRVVEALGRFGLDKVIIAPLTGGELEVIDCDLLALSGGFNPNIELNLLAGAKTNWDDHVFSLLPLPNTCRPNQWVWSIGCASGRFATDLIIRHAQAVVEQIARFDRTDNDNLAKRLLIEEDQQLAVDGYTGASVATVMPTPTAKGNGKRKWRTQPCFIDLQNDVTEADVQLSVREGMVEKNHLKRYSTLGMGVDQGRLAWHNAVICLSQALGVHPKQIDTTSYRSPLLSLPIGALAGMGVGEHFAPTRHSPVHLQLAESGANFYEAGLWMRAREYSGISNLSSAQLAQVISDEVSHLRLRAAIADISTLGKIVVRGPDARAFLDRLYVNDLSGLKPGRARYCLMLREDGLLLDDGTVSCIADDDFYVTTTTAQAAKVMSHMEYYAEVIYPQLQVFLASVSDQFATFSVAGPDSIRVLARLLGELQLEQLRNLAHMAHGYFEVALQKIWICRLSFSGELAYEISIEASYGSWLWQCVMLAGERYHLRAYGLEALEVLRIEKGHATGREIDGRCSLEALGLEKMRSANCDYVGYVMSQRSGLVGEESLRLVGLQVVDPSDKLKAGAMLCQSLEADDQVQIGYVSSAAYVYPHHDRSIGLGFIKRSYKAENIYARDFLSSKHFEVQIVSANFIDPSNKRLHQMPDAHHLLSEPLSFQAKYIEYPIDAETQNLSLKSAPNSESELILHAPKKLISVIRTLLPQAQIEKVAEQDGYLLKENERLKIELLEEDMQLQLQLRSEQSTQGTDTDSNQAVNISATKNIVINQDHAYVPILVAGNEVEFFLSGCASMQITATIFNQQVLIATSVFGVSVYILHSKHLSANLHAALAAEFVQVSPTSKVEHFYLLLTMRSFAQSLFEQLHKNANSFSALLK